MANNSIPIKGLEQENPNQRVIIVQQPNDPSVTSWEYVAKVINSSAFAVLVSWCVVGFLLWRGVKDAVKKHLALMETLNQTTRTNTQMLETNAASLRRLSLSNGRIAAIIERGADQHSQAIASELKNTMRVLDISAGMLKDCQENKKDCNTDKEEE